MALAALLAMGGCRAYGGGYIGAPLDSGLPSVYDGDASFGFNFTCEMNKRAKQATIRGVITYHDSGVSTVGGVDFPEIRVQGTVDPILVERVTTCKQAAEMFAGIPAAQFEGTYRSQDSTVPVSEPPGQFTVMVFDQGEPGRTRWTDVTGDEFSIDLIGGAYGAYSRAGYIEGGNVQVEN